jgi:Meiotically up-regulated gene 113
VSTFKQARGKTYRYRFYIDGVRYRGNTKQTTKAAADKVEAQEMEAVRQRFVTDRPPTPARKSPQAIYFVRCREAIKIGLTRDVPWRIANLQSAQPEPLELLLAVTGGRRAEAALHERFAHLRIRGEWFTAAPELLAFIAEIPVEVRR